MSARKSSRKTPANEIDMKLLVDLVEAGLTNEQIAKHMDRSLREITGELARAAIQPNRPPPAGGKLFWPLQ